MGDDGRTVVGRPTLGGRPVQSREQTEIEQVLALRRRSTALPCDACGMGPSVPSGSKNSAGSGLPTAQDAEDAEREALLGDAVRAHRTALAA